MKKSIGIAFLALFLIGFTACSDADVKSDLKEIKEDLAKTKEDLAKLKADHERLLKDEVKVEKAEEGKMEGAELN
jgi:cell division protein FtsB